MNSEVPFIMEKQWYRV